MVAGVTLFSVGQKNSASVFVTSSAQRLGGGIELPLCKENDSLIINSIGRYTLQYSPHYRSAMWVAYKLCAADLSGNAGRSNSFTQDRELAARGYVTARNGDYLKSGYDKGHLLPSADRQKTKQENCSTFILSNVSPQKPKLNRGVWKKLEEHIRREVTRCDTLYIVVGALLHPALPRLGLSAIAIPELYFKAILSRRNNHYFSAAYLIPNTETPRNNFFDYQISIDSLERLAKLRLFPKILGK
ncbi:Endonuclease [Mucinivorans hirudinis]|uniref:Endonuclease n=1 Tax=Mucinivorans hirudinis TaxID=1433126 RepID=A0A060RBT5_9BACT|nr:Endonuclease [Mucinivorans hirudinis]